MRPGIFPMYRASELHGTPCHRELFRPTTVVAGLCAAVAALGLAGCTSPTRAAFSGPELPAAVVSPVASLVPYERLDMVTPAQGWAVVPLKRTSSSVYWALYMTSDGGRVWSDVTPKGISTSGGVVGAFGRSQAWVAIDPWRFEHLGVLAESTDAGHLWKESVIPGLVNDPVPPGPEGIWRSLPPGGSGDGELWLVGGTAGPSAGPSAGPKVLFSTDAGMSWSAATVPSTAGLKGFRSLAGVSTSSGALWLGGMDSDGVPLAWESSNSGHSWVRVELSLPNRSPKAPGNGGTGVSADRTVVVEPPGNPSFESRSSLEPSPTSVTFAMITSGILPQLWLANGPAAGPFEVSQPLALSQEHGVFSVGDGGAWALGARGLYHAVGFANGWGVTWEPMAAGFPLADIAALDRTGPGSGYALTRTGTYSFALWSTTSEGSSWTKLGSIKLPPLPP